MKQHLKIASTGAAIVTALVVSAATVDWTPAPEPLPHRMRDFEARWQDGVSTIMLVEAYTTRQTVRVKEQPRVELSQVLTLPAVLPEPAPEAAAPVAAPVAVRKVSDICTRHGLRKVMTNRGRSWRCRA